MDDGLAGKLAYLQRRLREISKEAEDLRKQLHAAEIQQRRRYARIAQSLLKELHDYPIGHRQQNEQA